MRYDTICYFNVGSKTEYVNLIYRTEPTAKKYKKRTKRKSKKTDMLRSILYWVRGISGVSPEEQNGRSGGKDLQKKKVLSLE